MGTSTLTLGLSKYPIRATARVGTIQVLCREAVVVAGVVELGKGMGVKLTEVTEEATEGSESIVGVLLVILVLKTLLYCSIVVHQINKIPTSFIIVLCASTFL